MWIFTNGANIGTSLMIGDAVLQETQKREMFRLKEMQINYYAYYILYFILGQFQHTNVPI